MLHMQVPEAAALHALSAHRTKVSVGVGRTCHAWVEASTYRNASCMVL